MLLVNVVGALLIIGVIYWFWIYRPPTHPLSEGATIIVADGVYEPAHVSLLAEQQAPLRFLRKDPSPCAEQVVFPDLDLAYHLPVDEPVDITLPPLRPGEYRFHCQMNMYKGTLTVQA